MTDSPSHSYWPVSFGEAANLGLEQGARLGEELPVDFITPGVASLRAVCSADEHRRVSFMSS